MTVAGLAAIASACSSTGGSANPIAANSTVSSPTSTAPSSSTTAAAGPTTTSVDPTKAAVLAAYRAASADIDAVEDHYPIDVSDPRLADHIAGDELRQVTDFAMKLSFAGEYLPGPAIDTSGAIVKQLVGAVAVVSDCNVDGSILMNGKTNQVVKPATTDRTLVNAEIQLIAGVWKMTEYSNVGVTCTIAY